MTGLHQSSNRCIKVLPVCRYDDILVNGLPDWRQPVFYYRRVRKMSNAELGFLLFLILTVGHYAIIWSIYLEKQLVRRLIIAQLAHRRPIIK